ncbi:hypothetical protein [Dyella sp. 20L07]|uniref:hypothetical protein n=1 Tax=Dyella sp. 20L07 TaxID=3384240 RepID=UPI003D2CBE97
MEASSIEEIRCLLRSSFLFLIVLMVVGCASVPPPHSNYFHETYGLKDISPAAVGASEACANMQHVMANVDAIDQDAGMVETLLHASERVSVALDVATFALSSAFVLKASHGSHISNGARNLAFGAGAAYVGNTLFFPADAHTVYSTTDMALVCLSSRGNDILRSYDSAVVQLHRAEKYSQQCQNDSDLSASVRSVENVISAFGGQDSVFSGDLDKAHAVVISAMNKNLATIQPSPDTFLGAGRSIGVIPNLLVSEPNKPMRGGAKCDANETKDIENGLDKLTKAVTADLNNAEALISSCVGTSQDFSLPLGVYNAPLMVPPGQMQSFTVHGGKGPCQAHWKDTAPDTSNVSVIADEVSGKVTVIVQKASKIDKEFVMTVSDSSSPVKLTIDVIVGIKP